MPVVKTWDVRDARRKMGLSQSQMAAQLGVSVESYRTWDAGRRPAPPAIIGRMQTLRAPSPDERPLRLSALSQVIGVHVRTLRAAARDGRLAVTYRPRMFFGRVLTLATPAAARTFVDTFYRRPARYTTQPPKTRPLPCVPDNYAAQLVGLRRRLRLSQAQLAAKIGAASKAVVYQWEARKRVPSPVFWQRIESLERRHRSPSTRAPG
jgi:DNA-binding transcriptional regulator YiaG